MTRWIVLAVFSRATRSGVSGSSMSSSASAAPGSASNLVLKADSDQARASTRPMVLLLSNGIAIASNLGIGLRRRNLHSLLLAGGADMKIKAIHTHYVRIPFDMGAPRQDFAGLRFPTMDHLLV